MKAFRVLVVDDSPFMRKLVGDLIAKDSSFEVAGTASDGAEAYRQVCELRPDIVIMDLEMPAMNGLEALKLIMADCPTPVIMMSAVTDRGTRDTIRALQFGAFDFVRKPDGALKLDVVQMGEMLIDKLHIARELVTSGELRLRHMPEENVTSETAQDAADVPPLPQNTNRSPPPDAPVPFAEPHYAGEQSLETAAALEDEATNQKTGSQTQSSTAAGSASAEKRKPSAFPPEQKRASAKPAPKGPSRDEPAAPGRHSGPRRPANVTPADGRPFSAGRQAELSPGEKSERSASPAKPAALPDKPAKSPASAPAQEKQFATPASPFVTRPKGTFTDIVAIGTSTGGPRALHEVMSAIPASFPAPILIVQHMPPKFTHSLAQRLDSSSAIDVKEAEDGDPVLPGQAYLAPGGKHLKLLKDPGGGYRISLSEEDPVSGHRPSVDVMFGSLIGRSELRRHIVLMTGMGSDGAKAMKALREDGADTLIAEAEETCVVYGMPRSAMENGAAKTAVPLQRIAPELVRSVEKQKARQL